MLLEVRSVNSVTCATFHVHVMSLTFAALTSHLMTCFPALATGYMFSRACNWLHVFPRLQLVTCFPRSQLVTCFPAHATGYMFSLACNWLHVFSRLQVATCFRSLATGFTFSRASS